METMNRPDFMTKLTGKEVVAYTFFSAVVLIAAALKIGLLFTSQSLPDGDEAVTGLMAMHVLEKGIHPVYPYGVHYGAGAGIEIHLAALLFQLFGISEYTLKFAGILVWMFSCVILFLLCRKMFDVRVACLGVMLYALCPALSLSSLKVSGGHLVAVSAGLLAFWFMQYPRLRFAGLALVPVVGYLHPIAAVFAVALFAYGLYLDKGNRPRIVLSVGVFAAACIVSFLLFRPEGVGVYHPEARSLQPLSIFVASAKMVPYLFSPNINGLQYPGLLKLAVSLCWLGIAAAAILHAVRQQAYSLLFLSGACLGVVMMVQPDLLVPRHLMMLYPLLCILMALFLLNMERSTVAIACLAFLLLSGTGVSLSEMRSGYIYGAGDQSAGVNRDDFRNMMEILGRNRIHHVFSLDPMLQWNIIFASREKIIARWSEPRDRVQDYLRQVDGAWTSGAPVALVYTRQDSPASPPRIQIELKPDPSLIARYFSKAL